MRVVAQPRIPCPECFGRSADRQHFSYLQPPEYNMEVRGSRPISPVAAVFFNRSKPSKEQEEVVDTDTLLAQVALSRVRLPERTAPVRQAGHRCFV
jgi:hypothetical protein